MYRGVPSSASFLYSQETFVRVLSTVRTGWTGENCSSSPRCFPSPPCVCTYRVDEGELHQQSGGGKPHCVTPPCTTVRLSSQRDVEEDSGDWQLGLVGEKMLRLFLRSPCTMVCLPSAGWTWTIRSSSGGGRQG